MNPYQTETKIFDLFEKIKINKYNLQQLLGESKNKTHLCLGDKTKGFTHLHNCVIHTKKFAFLNEYIDEYLKLYPEEINVKNEIGFTAFMIAFVNYQRSTIETIEILIKHGANINCIDYIGWTPLMTFTVLKSYELDSICDLVEKLINQGMDINARDKFGRLALMLAINNTLFDSAQKMIKLLIKYGANIDFETKNKDNIITYSFNILTDGTGKSLIDFLLIDRKNFLSKVNAEKVLESGFKFHYIALYDFKIACKITSKFIDVLKYF